MRRSLSSITPAALVSAKRPYSLRAAARRTHNIGADVASPRDDLSGYALVVASATHILEEGTTDRLQDFVRGGGTPVTMGRSDAMGTHNTVVYRPLPDLHANVCGATVEEYNSLPDGIEAQLGRAGALEAGLTRPPSGSTCSSWMTRPLATYGSESCAGRPPVIARRFGAGTCVAMVSEPAFWDRIAGCHLEARRLRAPLAVPAKPGSQCVSAITGRGSCLTSRA
jgi:beta-galactosidase GanA